MKIRKYRPSDRERLLAITAEVFAPASLAALVEQRFGVRNDVPWQQLKQEQVAAEIDGDPAGTFVAEVAGAPIGFATTGTDAVTLTGHIHNLAVAADQQGRGMGKALLSAALDYFQTEGMMYSQIETLDCNEPAQLFYPRMGYQEVARKIYYFMPLAKRRSQV